MTKRKNKPVFKAIGNNNKQYANNGNVLVTEYHYDFSSDDCQKKKYLTPPPSRLGANIVGRDDFVYGLIDTFKTRRNIYVLRGIGGIGKTSVLKTLFYSSDLNDYFTNFCWINYNTTLEESIGEAFSGNNEQVNCNYALSLINNAENPIVFIDNLDKTLVEDNTIELLYKMNCVVVISSRFGYDNTVEYALDPLGESAAIALFYRHYNIEKNDVMCDLITASLDRHPLVIELVSRISQLCGYTLDQIFDAIVENPYMISANQKATLHKDEKSLEDTISGHIKKLFDVSMLSDEETATFKLLCAFCTTPIGIDKLVYLLELESRHVIYELLEKGWLLKENNEEIYIHKLISTAVIHADRLTIKDFEKIFIQVLTDDESEQINYLANIKELFEYCFDNESFYYEEGEREYFAQHYIFSRLVKDIGIVCRKFSDYRSAANYGIESAKMFNYLFSISHDIDIFPDLAGAYNNVGLAIHEIGEYPEAIRWYRCSLNTYNIYNQLCGKKMDEGLFNSYNNLGMSLLKLFKNQDALDCLEKADAIRKQVYPETSKEAGRVYNNYALFFSNIGDDAAELDYLKKALSASESVLSPSDENALVLKYNIVLKLIDLTQYRQAFEIVRDCLILIGDKDSIFKDKHIEGMFLGVLSQILGPLKKYEMALLCEQKAYEINAKILGENHGGVLLIFLNIMLLHFYLGHKDEAYQRALYLDNFVTNNVDVLGSMEVRIVLEIYSSIYTTLKKLDQNLALKYANKYVDLHIMLSKDLTETFLDASEVIIQSLLKEDKTEEAELLKKEIDDLYTATYSEKVNYIIYAGYMLICAHFSTFEKDYPSAVNTLRKIQGKLEENESTNTSVNKSLAYLCWKKRDFKLFGFVCKTFVIQMKRRYMIKRQNKSLVKDMKKFIRSYFSGEKTEKV